METEELLVASVLISVLCFVLVVFIVTSALSANSTDENPY